MTTEAAGENVGLVGLGNMGGPIGSHLISRGRKLHVVDTDPLRVKELVAKGAQAATSLADLAKQCPVILLSLPTPLIARAVVGDLLRLAAPGLILIDLSTNDPQTARDLGASAVAKSVRYIDAPVSGGPSRAATGELSMMVGGDEESVKRVWPLLSDVGAQIEHVGPSGCGTIAKLLNNFVALWGMVGVSQAFLATEALGISKERIYDVMSKSSGKSYLLDRNYPKIRDANFKPNFSLALAEKDLRLGLELMHQAGVAVVGEQQLIDLFNASSGDDGEMDVAVIYERLKGNART